MWAYYIIKKIYGEYNVAKRVKLIHLDPVKSAKSVSDLQEAYSTLLIINIIVV